MKTIREHYSWSQQQLFLASKLSFYKKYVLGKEDRSNIRFEKGKEFADYKETGEIPHYVEDPLLAQVGDAVPRLELIEHKLVVDLFKGRPKEKPEWSKPVLMFSDSCNRDFSEVYEYKTGKEAWTQQRVDDHEQLDFYAMLYYIASGHTIIPKFTLYWIETTDVILPNGDTSVRYTGHIEEFEREFTEKDIINMIMKTLGTMKDIFEWEYNELELEDSVVDRYVELLDKRDEIDSELNLIKLEVETEMEVTDMNYAVGSKGKFSFSERKNYSYSKELTEKASKYKAEITKLQNKEKKDKVANISITKSTRFTRSK